MIAVTGLPISQAQETPTKKISESNNPEAKIDPVVAPEKTDNPLQKLRKINDTTFQLGEITINKKDRSIKFDAEAEIITELIEYVLVTNQGKVHEALFITKARPIHLNIAFKLLGYKENKSLFREFVNNFPTDKYQTATEEEKAKSLFITEVSWIDDKTKKMVTYNLNDLIFNVRTKKTMDKNAAWSYGGSFMHQGNYVAEFNNDLIAIYTDRGAVANYAGEGREDDTLWHPVSDKMPARGTKVTLKITPNFPVDGKTTEK